MPDTIETAVYRLQTEGVEQLVQMGKAADQTAASEERLAQSTEKVTRATRTSVDGVERMIAGLDKRNRALQALMNGLERLQRYEDEGIGTATRRAVAEDLLLKRFNDTTEATGRAAARFAELQAKFDPATTSARKMAKEVADLNEAVSRGVNIEGGYVAALDKIEAKYNEVGNAAHQSAAIQVAAQQEINKALNVTAGYLSQSGSAGTVRSAASIRERLGLPAAAGGGGGGGGGGQPPRPPPSSGAAEQSFAVFNEAEAEKAIEAQKEAVLEQERLTAAAQRYRDQLNPVLQLERSRQDTLKELDVLLADGKLGLDEYYASIDRANAGFEQQRDVVTGVAEAHKSATAAAREAALEQEKLTASAQGYKDALDPLAASTRAFAAEVAKVNDLALRGKLSDDEREKSVNRLTEAYHKQQTAIEAASPGGQAAAKATADQEKLAASAQHLKDQINPVAAATRNYAAEIAKADELLKAKLITDRDHAAAVQMAKGKLDDFGKAARGSTSETDLLAQTNRRMTATVTNLSFQLNDVVTGLISGQQPLRIMAQQGGQIVQAFQQSPGGAAGALAAFRTFMVGLITPTTVAIGVLGGLGVVLALVLERAVKLDAQMRLFNVTLKGFGAEGQTTAAGLEQVETNLKGIGIAADEAREAILKVIRTPGINRGATESIVRTGAGLGVLTGAGTVAETQRLTDLVAKQDVDGLIELAIAYGKLDAPTAKFIRDQKELYGSGVATDKVFAIFAKNMKDVYASSLSDFAKALTDLRNAWDAFLKEAAVSRGIQELMTSIRTTVRDTFREIKEILEFIERMRNLPNTISNAINAAGNEATKKALENQQEMIDALAARDRESGITPPRSSPLASPVSPRPTTMPDGSASSTVPAPAKPAAKSDEELAREKATADQLQKNNDLLNKQTLEYGKLNAARRLYGLSQIEEEARIRGLDEAISKGLTGLAQKAYADRVADQARKERLIDLDKEAKTQALTNDLALKTAAAYGTSMAAGLRAAAEAQGILDQRAGKASNALEQQILLLRTAAAESAKSLGEQQAAGNNAIAAQERLATATAKGTSAAKEQEIQNEAVAKTETMLAQATALHDENLRKLALAYKDLFEAQGRAKEAATQTAAAFAEVNRMGRDLQVAQLESAMIGKAPEDVTRAISLLQGAQRIADQFGMATSKAKDDYAEMVANLANAQVHLAKLREEQERTNRLFQGVAGVIENTLGTAIDDIFSGKKIDDWGTRLKTMFGQVQATIAKETFLKPLIGTGLQLFGASPDVVKQYGSFLGSESKDATGEMVKKWADQLATTPLAVKTMTVEQATINVANAAAAVPATAAPGGPMAPVSPSALTGPLTGAEAGTAEAALQQAMTHEGERLTAYCAKLVNEALDKAGVPGSGSWLASSFKTFGTGVNPADVRRGDVFYAPPSGWGDTGHVGFATGPVQNGQVPVFSSHMQGDPNNPAGSEWRNADNLIFRRPDYAATQKATDQAVQDEQKLAEARAATSTATKVVTKEEDSLPARGTLTNDGVKLPADATSAEIAQAEKYLIAQKKLAEAQQQGATATEQAAQATNQQANDNTKLAGTATQTSAAVSAYDFELAKTATEAEKTGAAAAAAAGNLTGATTSIQTLADGTQMITTNVPLATAAARDLGAGAADAATNLDAQKAATAGTSTEAERAAETARSVSDGLSALGGSAASAAPNIQTLSGTLDALDEKVLQSAVGVQQAATSISNSAGTIAAASTVGASSTASLGSIASTVSNALRTGQGGFSPSSLTQGAGILDKILGLGGGKSGGGIFGNLLNGTGPSGGLLNGGVFSTGGLFGSQGSLFGTAADISIAGGGPPLALGAGGEAAFSAAGGASGLNLAGGALGGLGSVIGSVGMGFSAGSFLNGILGGNKLGGTIGSGLGSLVGMIGGPIGSLIGGALGGLVGGMFGNSKPSNASAGGNIDFASGRVTGTFQGGNQQIDQATIGAVKEISSFTQNLLKVSGGALSGNVLLQNGVNTGFTADSSLPGYVGRFSLGKDATAAVQTVELALSRSLTNISDTMKKVIGSITDPAELQAGIEFAGVYDKLKDAFDTAFSSISQETALVGPFGTALDQLNTTFQDLTDNANKYGLSLDPINAGLAEATKRLKEDFQTSLGQQEAQLVGGTDFLGQALQAHQQQVANWSDSVKLGFSTATDQLRVHQIEVAQLGAAFSNLSIDQLVKAVQVFAESAPEVASFAKGLLEAGQYVRDPIDQLILEITDPIEAAIEKERQAGEERVRIAEATGQDIVKVTQYNQMLLSQIWDQATASLVQLRTDLTTGASSGLTAADQVKAANDNFSRELALVQGGNLSELANLSTAASNAIQLSQQAYGNAPQTATLRDSIVAALDQVLGMNPNTVGVTTSATMTAKQVQDLIDAAILAARPTGPVVETIPVPETATVTDNTAAVTENTAATQSLTDAVTASATATSLNTINQTNVDLAGTAASGMTSTPPGTILVGEQGPELITQPGGLRIWSNPDTQRIMAGMPDRHFADGTANLGLPPRAPSNDDLRVAIASLSAEVRMLRQQSVRIQQVVGDETTKRLDRIAGGVEQGNRPAFEPPVEAPRLMAASAPPLLGSYLGVAEVSTTSGSGAFTLLGAIANSLPFSAKVPDGTTITVKVDGGAQIEFLVAIYTYPSTITPVSVISSTNGDQKIEWPATGQRIISLEQDIPAASLETLACPFPSDGVCAQALIKTGPDCYDNEWQYRPYPIAVWIDGAPTASQKVRLIVTEPIWFKADFEDSWAFCETTPSGDTYTITINRRDPFLELGTVTFGLGQREAFWGTTDDADQYLVPGDQLEFQCPADVDIIEDISITARGLIICKDMATRFCGGAYSGLGPDGGPSNSIMNFATPLGPSESVDTILIAGWMGYGSDDDGNTSIVIFNQHDDTFIAVTIGDGGLVPEGQFAFCFNLYDEFNSDVAGGYIICDLAGELRDTRWLPFAISIRASTQTIQIWCDGVLFDTPDPATFGWYSTSPFGSSVSWQADWQFAGAFVQPPGTYTHTPPAFTQGSPLSVMEFQPFSCSLSWYNFRLGLGEAFFDLSDEANIAKLFDTSSYPWRTVDWGPGGALVTGSQPLVYFQGDVKHFNTNRGYGGAVADPSNWTEGGPGEISGKVLNFIPLPDDA